MDINHSLLGWLGFFLIFFWEQTTVTKMYCSREYVTFLIDPKFLKVYSLLIWNQLKKSKTLPHKITKAVDWCVSPEDIFLWINLRTIPVMREDGLFMYVQILHTQQDNFHFWLALPQGILKLMRKKCYGKKKKNRCRKMKEVSLPAIFNNCRGQNTKSYNQNNPLYRWSWSCIPLNISVYWLRKKNNR